MPSVTITKIVKEGGGAGRIRIRFGKLEREYASLAHLQAAAKANLSVDDLIDIAIGLMLSRQPTLTNPNVFEGHTVTVNFAAVTNWGTVD